MNSFTIESQLYSFSTNLGLLIKASKPNGEEKEQECPELDFSSLISTF